KKIFKKLQKIIPVSRQASFFIINVDKRTGGFEMDVLGRVEIAPPLLATESEWPTTLLCSAASLINFDFTPVGFGLVSEQNETLEDIFTGFEELTLIGNVRKSPLSIGE